MRLKQLAVCAPTGEPVIAKIAATKDVVTIEVKKYNIKFHVPRPKYKLAIKKLEKYFEDFFLKGMADEDFNSSFRIDDDRGRTKKPDSKQKVGRTKRSRSVSGLHFGSRGEKSTEGSGVGVTDSAMAKIRHSSINGEDKDGD